MTEKKCFFRSKSLADGKPYIYAMHKTGEITGGSFSRASISFTTANVEIPRSEFAKNIHLLARGIKIFSVIVLPFLLYGIFELNNQPKYLLLFFLVGSIIGFLSVRIIYMLFSVKPKFRYADTYPEVQEFKAKGYVQGGHAMISNSLVGIVYHSAKLLF